MQSESILPKYYLKAGELFILDRPAMVSTVLGLCIAVTLYNQKIKLAGICHALLPQCMKRNFNKGIENLLDHKCYKCTEAFKYADCSVFMMAETFFRLGAKPEETEVRLFGGAKMMPYHSSALAKYSVGQQNIETAMTVLNHCNLTLTSFDVGGSAGRNIIFCTKNGNVAHHFIKQTIFKKALKKRGMTEKLSSACDRY